MLSFRGDLKYNEGAAASTTWKGIIFMAEFGENLKRVREEKGLTQQTLADNLYVTRQAVSRWEGGSRYPDLMTAKKMAQFLEVSLDELLTDDDMKLYVEKNAILENTVAKRAQLVLLSLAFMSVLFLSIVQIANLCFTEGDVFVYSSETPKYFLLTILLGISVFCALFNRLNVKTTLWIYGGYFGISVLINLLSVFSLPQGMSPMIFLGALALNLCCLAICSWFFTAKRVVSPIPVYIMCSVYALSGICNVFLADFGSIPTQLYRDIFMENTFAILQNLAMLSLLAVMAHVLHRKRKLSMK